MTSIESQVLQPYKYGFETDIAADVAPPGLSEDTIRLISRKKGEPDWMLDWRLKAFRHWLQMTEPRCLIVSSVSAFAGTDAPEAAKSITAKRCVFMISSLFLRQSLS